MTQFDTIELTKKADAQITRERERLKCNVHAYESAMTALFTAMRGTDPPALWSALSAASLAEYELTGASEVVGKLHDEVITCDVYSPGDPCSARTDCEYCRERCPLTKREKATPEEVA